MAGEPSIDPRSPVDRSEPLQLEQADAREPVPPAIMAGPDLALLDVPRTSAVLNLKIRNVCLLLSMAVVFNHARTLLFDYDWEGLKTVSFDTETSAHLWEVYLEHFLSGALGRITNPVFFSVSGFLFFYGWTPNAADWARKLRKRMFTLLVPYIVWSLLGRFLRFLDFLFRTRGEWMAGSGSGAWTPLDLLLSFLNMASPSQLWFLHDLMWIMVLWVPVLGFAIPRLRWGLLPILLVALLLPLPRPLVDKVGLCYFAFGAVLGFHRSHLAYPSSRLRVAIVACSVVLAVLYTVLSVGGEWPLQTLFRLMVLAGVAGAWAAYDWIPAGICRRLTNISAFRFFVYMGFDPVLPILQTYLQPWVYTTQATRLIAYFFLPILVITLLIAIARNFRRFAPSVYYIVTGGR